MQISVSILFIAAGLLCAGCPNAIRGTDAGGNVKLTSDLYLIDASLKQFKNVTGRLPTTDEGFAPLLERRLLTELPTDPWGRPYRYNTSTANERGYDLYSLGPDTTKDRDDIHLK